MSAPWARDLSPLVFTDFDDLSNTILLTPGSTKQVLAPKFNTVLGYPLKPYSQVAIASIAQGWDAAGNGNLTWSLLVNGCQDPRYINVPFVVAPPYGDTIYLPQPLWVPQLASVDFLVTLTAAATANVNFTGRIIPFYFLQDPNLQNLQYDPVRPTRTQGPRHVGTH